MCVCVERDRDRQTDRQINKQTEAKWDRGVKEREGESVQNSYIDWKQLQYKLFVGSRVNRILS